MAFGELWVVPGMAPGEPEQVPGWLMMAMGGVWQPTIDLSLRFAVFFAIGRSELTFFEDSGPSDALAARLCCQNVKRRVRVDPPLRVFWGVLGHGWGTCKEGI